MSETHVTLVADVKYNPGSTAADIHHWLVQVLLVHSALSAVVVLCMPSCLYGDDSS